jgi:hypothetical protein
MSPVSPPRYIECYWVVPDRFLAGEYPAHMDRPQVAERLDALLEAGVDALVDLTEPGELEPYFEELQARARLRGRSVSHQRFAIPDFGLPKQADMRALLDTIDASLAGGHTIYLHCWGGIGRTGLTVGCYLVRHGCTGSQALAQIAAWRAGLPGSRFHARSPETAEQTDFVRRWSEPAGAGGP